MTVAELCNFAGIPCTKRQLRKYANGQGMARHAQWLQLPERTKVVADARETLALAEEDLRLSEEAWETATPEQWNTRERLLRGTEKAIRRLMVQLEAAEANLGEARRRVPKYSPHLVRKQ